MSAMKVKARPGGISFPKWSMPPSRLTKSNIRRSVTEYTRRAETLNLGPIAAKFGLQLMHALKREKVRNWPYSKALSWFEGANRVMTDLVILHGVRHLFGNSGQFPFKAYTVKYGNEGATGFDIEAESNGVRLVGEAFNVADTFFQKKKCAALKKLREPAVEADFRIIMVNRDAVPMNYNPMVHDKEFFVLVDVLNGGANTVSLPRI